MAITLVGTIGAASQGAASAAVTPAWGTSETRVAGNLLIAWVTVTKSATLPTTPAGWSIAKQVAGTSTSATIYYKIAAGSDTAPTIAAITSGLIAAQLGEFTGNATTTPFDIGGTATGTSSPVTSTATGAQAASGELIVMAGGDTRSTARASNDTWTSNQGTVVLAGSNNGTSSMSHYSDGYILAGSSTTAATAVMTLSITTSITGLAVAEAAFKPATTTTYSGSFTANAWISDVTAATFTADASISKVGISGTFTADSHVSKSLSSTFTSDAYVKQERGNYGSDAQRVGTSATASSTGTSLFIPIPSGAQAGDLMVAQMAWDNTVANTATALPEGWLSANTLGTTGTTIRGVGAYKLLTASDTGVTLGVSNSTNLVGMSVAIRNPAGPAGLRQGSTMQTWSAGNAPNIPSQTASFSYYKQLRVFGFVAQLGAPALNPGSSGTTEIGEVSLGNITLAGYDAGNLNGWVSQTVNGFTVASSGSGDWSTLLWTVINPIEIFTADSWLGGTPTGTLTADADVKRNDIAGSVTADAYIMRTWWFGDVAAGFGS
jgi:hypothetical protein